MKTIIKVILISIIAVAIIGYTKHVSDWNQNYDRSRAAAQNSLDSWNSKPTEQYVSTTQNKSDGADVGIFNVKDNYSFLALNRSLWSKPSYIFGNSNSIEKFRIESDNWNFYNATIIINTSYIKNITFDNNKMVIQTT